MTLRRRLRSLRQDVLDRVRGEPNLDWLVRHGLELGLATHIAHPIYFDRTHPWLITIGDHVTLGPYVAIITHDASFAQHTAQTRLGRVVIGDRVNVGVGAVLLPGTVIGEDSVIGAGTVVRGEVPPESLAVGNPAQVSPLKPLIAFQRAQARRAPAWPQDGWTIATGITQERMREQREALDAGAAGYVPARTAPGSPYRRREQAAATAAATAASSATAGDVRP